MACVVAADVLLLLIKRRLLGLKVLILEQLEVLVGLGTRHKHNVLLNVTEGDLSAENMCGARLDDLLCDALWLVPLPDVDVLLGDIGQSYEQLFIFGTKRDADKLFVLLFKFVAGNELFAFELRVLQVVNTDDWGPVCPLSHR